MSQDETINWAELLQEGIEPASPDERQQLELWILDRSIECGARVVVGNVGSLQEEISVVGRTLGQHIRLYDAGSRAVVAASLALYESGNPYLPDLRRNLEEAYESMNSACRLASSLYENFHHLILMDLIADIYLDDQPYGISRSHAAIARCGLENSIDSQAYRTVINELYQREFVEDQPYGCELSSDELQVLQDELAQARRQYFYVNRASSPVLQGRHIAEALVYVFGERHEEHEAWSDFAAHARTVRTVSMYRHSDAELDMAVHTFTQIGQMIGIDQQDIDVALSMLIWTEQLN